VYSHAFVRAAAELLVAAASWFGVAGSKSFVWASKATPVAGSSTAKIRMILIVREGWWIGFISSNTRFSQDLPIPIHSISTSN
jgi:hypothetical protein